MGDKLCRSCAVVAKQPMCVEKSRCSRHVITSRRGRHRRLPPLAEERFLAM